MQNDTDQSGTITLTSITQPNYVKVWWADNTNRTCEPDDDIRYSNINIAN